MTLDFLKMVSRFRQVDDLESNTAFFRTRVPWIAPKAYLNMVFKPLAVTGSQRCCRAAPFARRILQAARAAERGDSVLWSSQRLWHSSTGTTDGSFGPLFSTPLGHRAPESKLCTGRSRSLPSHWKLRV